MAQGHIDNMRNVCDAVFGEERFGLLRFSVPFNSVGIELREVSLPAGFRRALLGLHPAGTVDPRFATREREDGPPRLIRQAERAWTEWLEMHDIMPPGEDPVWGLVAWPALPYCGNGMEFEIIQELENDFFN
ncbi:hypothetical protein BFJ68_g5192 [Fusarium oxysporum]|uniref:Uncharacterized protein n=1 Tax=Fusarium oxysporum TaxID=5507 RepID=A0A420RHT9_FUSOX|nr:hypothetical protein BFJ71_g5263 [Fusarium oxysporum]RKL16577.1 hypothetical protein BFJ68_g5192 [Fusarium oxysporum]